mgnify:CR=1 FL=1
MILYLLKSIMCLALFFAFYKIVLERVKMPLFKRFYLLGILIFASIIPFVSFFGVAHIPQTLVLSTSTSSMFDDSTMKILTPTISLSDDWMWVLYFSGVVILSIRFTVGLLKLRQLINHNYKIQENTYTQVLVPEAQVPCTFLHYIFLPKQEAETSSLAKEVLLHEQAHVDQKHSLDILFIELLQIFFWWNPIIYWVKNAIKLNHEFLADQQVLRQNGEKINYQKLLLHYSSTMGTKFLMN